MRLGWSLPFVTIGDVALHQGLGSANIGQDRVQDFVGEALLGLRRLPDVERPPAAVRRRTLGVIGAAGRELAFQGLRTLLLVLWFLELRSHPAVPAWEREVQLGLADLEVLAVRLHGSA